MADIYLWIEGKQEGPHSQEQVRQSLSKGIINANTSAWRDGLPDWVPVERLIGNGFEVPLADASPNIPLVKPKHTGDRECVPDSSSTQTIGTVDGARGVKSKSKSYKSLWPGAAGLVLFGLSVGVGIGFVITASGLGTHLLYIISQRQNDSKQGDVFRVFQPADEPSEAWFGYLDRTDGTTTEIIVAFGNGATVTDEDRIDAVFVPTNETGEYNHQRYRIYKVQGTFKFEHPAH